MKALSQRASERYATAKDMADDLLHFLAENDRGTGSSTFDAVPPGGAAAATGSRTPSSATVTRMPSAPPIPKIVPKGLRSFDSHDTDFFLELLPGARDREGLPESIRFWKTRIEDTEAEKTFSVGLICGPSGCGKSSMVQAGLLPRLADDVLSVYVEATARETEARLLTGLRKRCPGLPPELGLKETLGALRRGQGIRVGKKVLIILDQFEQWLHAKQQEENTELVHALRQCDGGSVQCVVMVRDDFWMAVIRFMQELEVRLVEGQNSAAVDLFPIRHAEKVLAAFGRAFGALPEGPGGMSKQQKQFIEQAVSGLAQEGKVICVRLALFAEMMKGKPWTPATLKEAGGTEGVGITFLEETFSASPAPPEHRYHEKAARAVLKALLPESGKDIKGNMRSEAELLALSGYGGRIRDFESLLGILDGEVRLITPTGPEGVAGGGWRGAGHYQLTHDYLVRPLREWLTRKQRETRRGRAELRLEERAALWCARKENRFLPSASEWLNLRLLTRSRDWTAPQRTMMHRAGWRHAAHGAILFVGMMVLALLVREGYGRQRARGLEARLLEATTADVPDIVGEMGPYRRWLDGELRQAYADAAAAHDARRELHASLALLPVDPGQVSYLRKRLLSANPEEVFVIRGALLPYAGDISAWLWEVLENGKTVSGERLRAACALAVYAAGDTRWNGVSRDVAARLVTEPVLVIARWAEALRPVRKHLLSSLAALLVESDQDAARRLTITRLYGDYSQGLAEPFAPLEEEAAGIIKPNGGDGGAVTDSVTDPNARLAQQRRQANAAVALAALGRWEMARLLLEHTRNPTMRSYVIDRLASGGADARGLDALISDGSEVSVRRASLLALAEFDEQNLPFPERERLAPCLAAMYRDDPDPGVHAAAGWLLGRWGEPGRLVDANRSLAKGAPIGSRRWYLNSQGQTLVLIPPGKFRQGEEPGRSEYCVDHGFALAAREVSVAEFRVFRSSYKCNRAFALTEDCPVHEVTWYDAAAYCNWLSEQDGIPKEQWCYLPNDKGQYAEGMKIVPDYLSRSGYRLPTVNEWEYACRAGSVTRWQFGEAEDLIARYAWCVVNSSSRLHPVGSLRPNDLGLFDMHGNAWEWCQNRAGSASADGKSSAVRNVVSDADRWLARSGGFGHGLLTVQSANAIDIHVKEGGGDLGFRPARSLRINDRR